MKIQKLYPLVLGCLLLAGGLYYGFFSQTETTPEALHSGAYESLSFLGAARAFPNADLPEEGYYAAFEKLQQSTAGLQAKVQTEPWESMGPHNRAGRMLSIAINPQNNQTLFAGSASGGLWRSHTRGAGVDAWERIETGFPALGISTIAFAPGDSNTIYIGTGEVYNAFAAGTGAAYRNTRGSYGIGILKSTDGGVTWRFSLDWTSRQTQGIWNIKVHPSDPNLLWAATTDGTYKSTDAGENWEKIHNVLLGTSLLVHPDDPDRLVAAYGNFASAGSGIYTTSNGGQNWTQAGDPLPTGFRGKIQLAMSPSQPNTIYASIGNGFGFNDGASWLCRSDDFGATWRVQSTEDYSKWQGWYSHDVAVHPSNPDEVMVIGIDVWKSTDGGKTINQQSLGGIGVFDPPIGDPGAEPTFVHSDCHVVIYDAQTNHIYIGNDGGIHRSEDGGDSFIASNGRLQTTQFYNGFSNSTQDSMIAIGGLQDNGSNLISGDKRWAVVLGGDGSWTGINPNNDDMIFASAQFLNMRRSTTGGEFFNNIRPPLDNDFTSFIAPFVIAPNGFDDNVIIYAGSNHVYRSVDSGDYWEATNGDTPLDGNPVLAMAMDTSDIFVVYAATAPANGNPSRVHLTVSGGDSWVDITQDLPNAFPMDLTLDPTDNRRAYITYSGFNNPHVFRTENQGEDWIDISADLPNVPTNAVIVDPLFPSNVYVGNDLGVFASIDYGETWSPYQEGLPAAIMVFDLTISPSNRKLRIASHGNGVYQRDLLEEEFISVGTEEAVANPINFKLWPNPANDWLQVEWETAGESFFEASLLDASGKVQAQTNGAGSLQFPVDRLASGLYYCRIQTAEKTFMKKVKIVH